MHPAIREFPSKFFYDDVLKDGMGMTTLNARPWHAYSAFRPFVFYDAKGKSYRRRGTRGRTTKRRNFGVFDSKPAQTVS